MEQTKSDHEMKELSNEQLRDVIDVLRQPLSSRKVLVPFGRQAFLAATLAPNMSDAQEELVQMKTSDGCIRQMTRADARKLLENEFAVRTRANNKTSGFRNKPEKSLQPQSTTSKPSPARPNAVTSYFDIREEIDESGNLVGGEAIDITDRLRQMDSHTVDPVGSSSREEVNGVSLTVEETPDTLKELNDEEYESLAARLEELARMEDNAESQKKFSQSGRAQLDGDSWAKGFLNKRKGAKPKQVPTIDEAGKKYDKSTIANQPRKTVVFNDAGPEIKEIPRIGERSFKQEQESLSRFKKASGWSKGFLNSPVKRNGPTVEPRLSAGTSDGSPFVTSVEATPRALPVKSFDEQVLSSVVMEHIVADKQPEEPPTEGRKLSRFAQRRMQAVQQPQV